MNNSFKRLIIGVSMSVLLATLTAYADSGTINSSDNNGNEKNDFTTEEIVYLSGTCLDAADQTVDAYIVAQQETWTDQDSLSDSRGNASELNFDSDGNFPTTMLWESPATGDYQIIIDLDRDGLYDEGIENCIDSPSETGFTVVTPSSTTPASLGANNPSNQQWTIGESDSEHLMLQINLAPNESLELSTFTLQASGSGNDATAITKVMLVEENQDMIWAEGNYLEDDGSLELSVTKTLEADSSTDLAVIYQLDANNISAGDTFSLEITEISNVADVSLQSSITTAVMPAEELMCSGDLILTLIENESTITAEVSGLTECSGKKINVRQGSCTGNIMCSCNSGDTGCSCDFTPPNQEGEYDYFACLDLDDDTDQIADEPEEKDTESLVVEEIEQILEVTVVATGKTKRNLLQLFEDIRGHWAEEFIEDLAEQGVVSGKSEDTFDPDANITRAEVTKIALISFGYEIPDSVSTSPFSDVSTTQWFAPYVQAAKTTGIVRGYSNGTFRPNQPINRVEVLKILLTAAEKDVSSAPTATFPDTLSEVWYSPFLNYGIQKQLLNGYTGGEFDGLFRPEFSATRAEVAKIVSLLLDVK